MGNTCAPIKDVDIRHWEAHAVQVLEKENVKQSESITKLQIFEHRYLELNDEHMRAVQSYEHQLEELQRENADLRDRLQGSICDQGDRVREAVYTSMQAQLAEHEKSRAAYDEARAIMDDLKIKADAAAGEAAELRAKLAAADENAGDRLAEAERKAAAAAEEAARLRDESTAKDYRIQTLEADRARANTAAADAKDEVGYLKTELAGVRSECEVLREEVARLRATEETVAEMSRMIAALEAKILKIAAEAADRPPIPPPVPPPPPPYPTQDPSTNRFSHPHSTYQHNHNNTVSCSPLPLVQLVAGSPQFSSSTQPPNAPPFTERKDTSGGGGGGYSGDISGHLVAAAALRAHDQNETLQDIKTALRTMSSQLSSLEPRSRGVRGAVLHAHRANPRVILCPKHGPRP